MNFVKVYKYPIVFQNLAKLDTNGYELEYAGNLKQQFDPSKLSLDQDGHFLHPLSEHKYINIGAFDTSLSISLGEKIVEDGDKMYIEWENERYPLNIL